MRARLRCRETGLLWEVGFSFDRYPEPFTAIAAESLDDLARLLARGAARGDPREVARAAADLGRWSIAADLLAPIVARQGPAGDARFAYVRACRHLGRWREILALLGETVRDPRHEAADLELWLRAHAHLDLPLPEDAIPRVLAEVPRCAAYLRRQGFALPIPSTQEPALFLALPGLFLRAGRLADGIAELAARAEAYDLSLALPFGWAVLLWASGGDPQPPIERIRERAAQIQLLAHRPPCEALTAPILWALLPEPHHAAAAEVLVSLGARSVFSVLAAAGIGLQGTTAD